MALLYDKVVHTVSKPPKERTEGMIEQILPWFRKRSELFKSQKTEIVKDIVKNCQFMTCKRDHVVIKQGDKGDCFYIILSGSVAIYIHTHLDEGGISYVDHTDEFGLSGKPKELDRTPFGNYVGTIPAGKSFGELALINADCVRNASIIADETTDLLIVNRELYSRSLKAFQEKEFNEKKTFVEEYPLFKGWQTRYKKQLAMSLRKEKVNFDGIVVKQGCPVDGICFLLSGQAKMLVDPVVHEIQYPDMFPLPDIKELEKVEARESIRREMNMASIKVEEKKLSYRPRSPNPDRKRAHRNVEVCTMGAVEILGDLEMTMGLNSYAETAQCTQVAEVFILDQKNYERLIERRNPQALDTMREALHEKLQLRLTWVQEDELPLFKYFLYKLDERKRHEKEKYREMRRRDHFFDWKTGLQKGPLIDQFGPGSIFYTIRMRDKSRRGPGTMSAKSGSRGFGITKHLLLGRNHGAAYLSRKPVYSSDHNMNTPDNFIGANHSNNSDSEDSKDDENQSDVDAIDIDIVDSRKMNKKNERPGKSQILCENANDNSKGNLKVQRAKSEKSVDDFKNKELSEFNLVRLETRIEAWHSKVDEISDERKTSKKHLVKLHRYNAEDNKKPMPGKKIILKPKAKPKANLLTLHFDALRKSALSSQSILASRLSRAKSATKTTSVM